MPPSDPPPRMPPVARKDLTGDRGEFLKKWSGGFFKDADKHPVLLTFAHSPKMADVFSAFNIQVLTANSLPVKQRQIAIMRLAWVTGATFMWSSHLNTSISVGLDDSMYEPLKIGASDPYFTDFERSVIIGTEELVAHYKLGDTTWDALMQEWSNEQMLDFLFTVGCYMTVACVMGSTGVQRMPELIDLAERYGAPV